MLPRDFFHIAVPEGFHSLNPNAFDITTETGLKLYRLRQAFTPDRWGFLGARSPYTPRVIQIAFKNPFLSEAGRAATDNLPRTRSPTRTRSRPAARKRT